MPTRAKELVRQEMYQALDAALHEVQCSFLPFLPLAVMGSSPLHLVQTFGRSWGSARDGYIG